MTYNGSISYHTDFSSNQEIRADIEEAPLFTTRRKYLFRTRASFSRFHIPSLHMNMNSYRLGVTLPSDSRLSTCVAIEYINQRNPHQKDNAAIAGTLYYDPNFGVQPHASAGVSHNGKFQFSVGISAYHWKYFPIYANISAGYWMGHFKCNAELSKSFKRISIIAGYERFMNYENAYLTLRIPYRKYEGGVWYQNLLK